MRNTLQIILNTLKVTFRKKGNIIVYIFLPLLGILFSILIYSGSGSSSLRVGVVNKDSGILSGDLKAALQASDKFRISVVKEDEINDKLLDRKLDAAVIIPEGYTESIYAGKPEELSVISLKGQETTVWIEQLLNSSTDTMLKLFAASNGDKAVFESLYNKYKEDKVRLNIVRLEDKKAGKYMTLSSTGFLIMFIMLGASLITTFILKEKRNRTYYRICAAPVKSRQYITANAVTGLLIVIVQIIIIQLAMKFVFHIDTGVADILMFVILLMFGIVAIGIGLVVTAFSSSSYMAGTLGSLVMTPTCMLGGCFWSIDMMPDIMQKIGYFVPQRWAIDAILKLQAGGSSGDIVMNLVILAAFAVAFLLIAIYRFSRTSNLQKFV